MRFQRESSDTPAVLDAPRVARNNRPMSDVFTCPHCGGTWPSASAGAVERSCLNRPTLSAGAIEQRRAAGKARAAGARNFGRDQTGRFLPRAEQAQRCAEYDDWLHEIPGRAGGIARADYAERDELGCFMAEPIRPTSR